VNVLSNQPQAVLYLPIATTMLSAVFCAALLRRYEYKGKGAHLLWWAAGVVFYGAGTGLESSITLFGNSIALTKAWYVFGALLGGYPLAQGTVYLLLRRRTANVLTALSLPFILVISLLVVLSPVHADQLNPVKPDGDILGWQWLRLCTPVINCYAGLFLIGGAILSAKRFARQAATRHRAIGNALIAAGALLPAIGGSMAKFGIVEGLYVGEFAGIILIWLGYAFCVRRPAGQPRQAGSSVVVSPSAGSDTSAAGRP
jgi:hypothetical protein